MDGDSYFVGNNKKSTTIIFVMHSDMSKFVRGKPNK